MEEVLVFNSLAKAKKSQTVELDKLYFIKGKKLNLSRLTRTWKESDASSLDDKVKKSPLYREGILVKATDDKVKFYYLGGGRALCIEGTYSTAMKSIFG